MAALLILALCLACFVEADKSLDYTPFLRSFKNNNGKLQDWYEDIYLEEINDLTEDQLYPSGDLSQEVITPKQLYADIKDKTDILLYSVQISGKPYTLFLKKQTFMHKDFQIFIDDNEETHLFKSNVNDCYFHGIALEAAGSSVTLRTCFGLRGILEFDQESFIIQPYELVSGFQHRVYKMEDYKGTVILSVNDTDLTSLNYQQTLYEKSQPFSKPRKSIFQTTRYLEIAVFVTVEVYKALGSSPSNIVSKFSQVFSYLSPMFAPLNLQIFFSQINIWTVSDFIPVGDDLNYTVEKFVSYLSEVSAHLRKYDIPLLIVVGDPSKAGITYFAQMCSSRNGAVVTFPKGLSISKYSSLIAHILGHNLGMLHDNPRECKCAAPACLMDTHLMDFANVRSFSSCNIKDFEKFVMETGARCLLSLRDKKLIADPSLCGNKMLDKGETCDCGTESECINDACCDYKTCSLRAGATCANGPCCVNCQFLPAGVLCRSAVDECDLPEFCSGTQAVCADDVYQQNGNPCNNGTNICFHGECQSADLQCKQIFGPGSKSASYECYRKLNVVGDKFGNCGGFQGYYAKCDINDVLCGKIQCAISEDVKVPIPNAAFTFYMPKEETCARADLGEIAYPVQVKDGTKCADNKICFEQKCTIFSSSDFLCEPEITCGGHGICNNKHNCHCDRGWKPPFCREPRADEGLDSRSLDPNTGIISEKPTNGMNEHLRNWLLIVFLLILPLLIITVIIFRVLFKRYSEGKEPKDDEEENKSDEDEESTKGSPDRATK